VNIKRVLTFDIFDLQLKKQSAGGIISMSDCACFGSFAMQGVCSEGPNSVVNLENCSVFSHFEACIAALASGFICARSCEICKSEKSRGISIEGVGSKAVIENCIVHQCFSAAVCVLGSAQCILRMSQLHDILGFRSQCVCVQGQGSKCTIEQSSVSNCSGSCVVALAGGCVTLLHSKIFASVTMQGISSQGNDSTIIAENCSISNTREACVASLRGGLVRLTGCNISKSMSRGVAVEGASLVELFSCIIEMCYGTCAVISEGGKLFATNSCFQETVAAHGQGICVEGSSSNAILVGCKISKISATGIISLSAASVQLDNCLIDTCGLQGCASQGRGSSIVAKNSKFSNHKESACACAAGGTMNLIGCQMSKSYYGVCCEDLGAAVIVDACQLFNNQQCGIITVDGGSVTVTSTNISNQDLIPSHGIICCGVASRILASDCTIENISKCLICALDGGYVALRSCSVLRSFESHLLLAQGPESTIKAMNCKISSSLLACIVAVAGGSINVLKCDVSESCLRQIILSRGPKSIIIARDSQCYSAFGTCVLAAASGTCSLSNCLVHTSQTMQGVCAEGSLSHVSMVKCVIRECKHSLTLACGGGLVELDGCQLSKANHHALCCQNPKSVLRVQSSVINGSIASLNGGSVIVSNSRSDSQVICCGSGSFFNVQASSIFSPCFADFLVSDSARANVDQCMLVFSNIQVQGKNSSVSISHSIINSSVKAGKAPFKGIILLRIRN
jgi:hypothetical protein